MYLKKQFDRTAVREWFSFLGQIRLCNVPWTHTSSSSKLGANISCDFQHLMILFDDCLLKSGHSKHRCKMRRFHAVFISSDAKFISLEYQRSIPIQHSGRWMQTMSVLTSCYSWMRTNCPSRTGYWHIGFSIDHQNHDMPSVVQWLDDLSTDRRTPRHQSESSQVRSLRIYM